MGNIKSILYLKDGRTCTGYLSINKEHKKNDKISIQSGNNSKPQFFKSKKVKGYTIGDDHFYLKEVGNNTLVIEKWNSFLEQPFQKEVLLFETAYI